MTAHRLPHLAQRLFNRPLAITPDKAEIVMAALADRFGVAHLFRADSGAVPLKTRTSDGWGGTIEKQAYEVEQDVAIIPIEGTLVHRLGSVHPESGLTGYDGLSQCFMHAVTDPGTRAIVLDIDSPGGEVAGCFDFVDLIYRARGTKPVWAILNECAFSAAYAIASAADVITVPRTGGTGSVGVIMLHTDLSQALSKAGIAVTVITYGARKADSRPELPLSADALAAMQADTDTMGDMFVELVARNRNMTAAAVKATQAACYLGQASKDVGFADAVMAPADAFATLLASL
jgi:signal peptide peptidase SppA